jgi:cytochrome d ubiquinol oxidase subunit II
VFLLACDGAPLIHAGLTRWWAPLLLGATSACALAALFALWTRRFRLARGAAAGQVSLILLGWGLAQYPYLVVPDVTLESAATERATLRLIAIALGVGAVFLLPSFVYLYRVFKPPRRDAEHG